MIVDLGFSIEKPLQKLLTAEVAEKIRGARREIHHGLLT
jgi:hypothetical protein